MRYSSLALLLATLHLITAIPTPAEDKPAKAPANSAPVDVNVPVPKRSVASAASAAVVPEIPGSGPGVDGGDATKRVVRGSVVEFYDDDDDDDENQKNIVPELIPIAENRKARGNGADDLNTVVDENGVEVVDMSYIDGIERDGRGEGLLDGDVEMDSALGGRSQKCSKDGESCQENSGCCSGFCSWTRGFACYTVVG